MMQMMRGDSYNIAITLTYDDETTITPEDVTDVEVVLGNLVKRYSTGDISYDDGEWLFPITQTDSFYDLPPVSRLQVRVKNGTTVIGARIGVVFVLPSNSSEAM